MKLLVLCFAFSSAWAFAPRSSVELDQDDLQVYAEYMGKQALTEVTSVLMKYATSAQKMTAKSEPCNDLMRPFDQSCQDCVKDECTSKASGCKSWDEKLGMIFKHYGEKAIEPFKDFFGDMLPSLVVDKIGGFMEKAGSGVADFITGFGSDIGDFFSNLGGDFWDNIKDISGNLGGVIDVGKDIGKFFGNIFSGIGSGIGGIFGRHKRDDTQKYLADIDKKLVAIYGSTDEPSCDALEDTDAEACMYYMKKCPACIQIPSKKKELCPEYVEAEQAVFDVLNGNKWIAQMWDVDGHVQLLKLSHGPQVGSGFKQYHENVRFSIRAFGLEFHDLTPIEDVNVYSPATASRILTKTALRKVNEQVVDHFDIGAVASALNSHMETYFSKGK